MKKVWILLAALLISTSARASNVNALSYSSTNVTTSAYVTLVSSSPITVSKIQVCDTSGKILKLAQGAASSEVDFCTIQVSGCVVVPVFIPAGTRISIRAIDASATSGYNTLSFVP